MNGGGIEHQFIQANELVTHTSRDGVYAGGFKIDSALMAAGSSCAEINQKGGALSGLKGLAVPAGLLFIQRTIANNDIEYQKKDAVIDDSLFDKLVHLASVSDSRKPDKSVNKNKHTKRRRSANIRTTRRTK